MAMRTLCLPGFIPNTTVQFMLDDSTKELRSAVMHNSNSWAAVWLYAKSDSARIQLDNGNPGTFDLWLGRCSLTLPIEQGAQLEAFLSCEPAHAP